MNIANATIEPHDATVFGDDSKTDNDNNNNTNNSDSDSDSNSDSESDTKSDNGNEKDTESTNNENNNNNNSKKDEPFVYMSTSPTKEGPRNSVRLEGLKRYNRGLFILDVRHMPAGCATWPAFWMTDEPNWPVNGEIDILEGVNGQSVVKTALHSTMNCKMDDVPIGVKTGSWVGYVII